MSLKPNKTTNVLIYCLYAVIVSVIVLGLASTFMGETSTTTSTPTYQTTTQSPF